MLLYERFEISGDIPSHTAVAQDIVLKRTVTLWRTPVPPEQMASKLAEASRIFAGWEARNAATAEKPELFSSPGYVWLVAESATATAGLLEVLRAAGMFVVAPPPPPKPPAPPPRASAPPPSPRTQGPAVYPPPVRPFQESPKAARGKKSFSFRTLLIAAVALLAAILILFNLHRTSSPTRKPAPVVSFKASHIRVHRGAMVTLRWETSGVDSLSIQPGIGPVPASGTRAVVVNADTTYVLRSTTADTPTLAAVTVTVSAAVRHRKPAAAPAETPADTSETP